VIALQPHQIHLWHIDLNLPVDSTLLNSLELNRYQQLPPYGQQKYGMSRIALRQILAHYLDIAPQTIEYMHNAFGKPSVDGTIQFNLSHAQNSAVIAIALEDIGVDIEPSQRTVAKARSIAKRFFHHDETRWILEHSSAQQTAVFLQCWAAKEAIVKAIGTGLSHQLAAFSVAETSQVTPPNADTWYLYPFTASNMFGYIAYRQPDCEISHYEFAPTDITV